MIEVTGKLFNHEGNTIPYHSNNVHIVAIDRFGFKVEKTHYYLFFCRKETFNNNFYLSL